MLWVQHIDSIQWNQHWGNSHEKVWASSRAKHHIWSHQLLNFCFSHMTPMAALQRLYGLWQDGQQPFHCGDSGSSTLEASEPSEPSEPSHPADLPHIPSRAAAFGSPLQPICLVVSQGRHANMLDQVQWPEKVVDRGINATCPRQDLQVEGIDLVWCPKLCATIPRRMPNPVRDSVDTAVPVTSAVHQSPRTSSTESRLMMLNDSSIFSSIQTNTGVMREIERTGGFPFLDHGIPIGWSASSGSSLWCAGPWLGLLFTGRYQGLVWSTRSTPTPLRAATRTPISCSWHLRLSCCTMGSTWLSLSLSPSLHIYTVYNIIW